MKTTEAAVTTTIKMTCSPNLALYLADYLFNWLRLTIYLLYAPSVYMNESTCRMLTSLPICLPARSLFIAYMLPEVSII